MQTVLQWSERNLKKWWFWFTFAHLCSPLSLSYQTCVICFFQVSPTRFIQMIMTRMKNKSNPTLTAYPWEWGEGKWWWCFAKKSVVWSHKFKTFPFFSFYNREGALSYSEKKKKLLHSITLQHLSYWVGNPLGQNLTHKKINLWRIEGEKSRGFDFYQLSLDDCFSV